jgi:hypothetical protein
MLYLSDAGPGDAEKIASIHLAAFDSNVLLHAQFPTPGSLAVLHSILSQELLYTIQNAQVSGKAVMVVRDTEAESQIISFAKWNLPNLSKGGYHVGAAWHVDTRQDLLDLYHEKADNALARVIGDRSCYRKPSPFCQLPRHASSAPPYIVFLYRVQHRPK